MGESVGEHIWMEASGVLAFLLAEGFSAHRHKVSHLSSTPIKATCRCLFRPHGFVVALC